MSRWDYSKHCVIIENCYTEENFKGLGRGISYNCVYFNQLLTLNFKREEQKVFHRQFLQPSIKQRDIEVF